MVRLQNPENVVHYHVFPDWRLPPCPALAKTVPTSLPSSAPVPVTGPVMALPVASASPRRATGPTGPHPCLPRRQVPTSPSRTCLCHHSKALWLAPTRNGSAPARPGHARAPPQTRVSGNSLLGE